MFIPCNISDFRFISYKKKCLDSNVIWRLFGFGPSWILTVQNRWYDRGGKPKFFQITGCESTLNFVIWCHEGLKPNNFKLQGWNLKKKNTWK